MPDLPQNFQDWPADAVELDSDEVVRLYEGGFAGAKDDPAARQRLWERVEANGGIRSGAVAGSNLVGSGEGKLSIPFVYLFKLWPDCLPGGSQARGDCVSWSTRNAALLTMACEITAGVPDAVTGKIEGAPEIPAEGIPYGVLSTEAIYWWRDHGGDGWSCDHAADVVLHESGLWIRQAYSDFGFDLTRYSGGTAGKWGSRNPPAEIKQFGLQHAIRTATEVETFEQVRDMLSNGYGITTCGGEGWSSSRDENGFSKRSGSWAHALALVGVDDREEIKSKYGEPLVCVQNSWGSWNSGGRRILGTTIDIPVGSFWAKWSDFKRRQMIAFSGVNGWPSKTLPDWGTLGLI